MPAAAAAAAGITVIIANLKTIGIYNIQLTSGEREKEELGNPSRLTLIYCCCCCCCGNILNIEQWRQQGKARQGKAEMRSAKRQ